MWGKWLIFAECKLYTHVSFSDIKSFLLDCPDAGLGGILRNRPVKRNSNKKKTSSSDYVPRYMQKNAKMKNVGLVLNVFSHFVMSNTC